MSKRNTAAGQIVLGLLLGFLPFSFVNTGYLILAQLKNSVPEKEQISALFSSMYALTNVIALPYNIVTDILGHKWSIQKVRRIHWVSLVFVGVVGVVFESLIPSCWTIQGHVFGATRSVFLMVSGIASGITGAWGSIALMAYMSPFSPSAVSACSAGLYLLSIIPSIIAVAASSSFTIFWNEHGVAILSYAGSAATLIGTVAVLFSGWRGPDPVWRETADGSAVCEIPSADCVSVTPEPTQPGSPQLGEEPLAAAAPPPKRCGVAVPQWCRELIYPFHSLVASLIFCFLFPGFAGFATSDCGRATAEQATKMNNWAVLLFLACGCLTRALSDLLKVGNTYALLGLNALAVGMAAACVAAPLQGWGTHWGLQLLFALCAADDGLVATGAFLVPPDYSARSRQRVFSRNVFCAQLGNLISQFTSPFVIQAITNYCPVI